MFTFHVNLKNLFLIYFILEYSWLTMNVILISAVQQSDSVLHMYLIFFKFFPHVVIAEYWAEFPVLYSRSLLVIYSIYSSVHINPRVLIYLHPSSSLVTVSSFSKSVSFFCFALINKVMFTFPMNFGFSWRFVNRYYPPATKPALCFGRFTEKSFSNSTIA